MYMYIYIYMHIYVYIYVYIYMIWYDDIVIRPHPHHDFSTLFWGTPKTGTSVQKKLKKSLPAKPSEVIPWWRRAKDVLDVDTLW